MSSDLTPLFICGCARSGTSAFTRYLTRHKSKQFAIFMERYLNLWKNNQKFPEDAFSEERIKKIIEGDTFYKTLDRFENNIIALQNLGSAKFVGDKIPSLWQNFQSLFEQFSNAKVFYLLRDLYGVAASYKKRSINNEDTYWGRHRDVFFAIKEWSKSIELLIEYFNFDKDFHQRIYIMEFYKFSTNSFDKKELNIFLETDLVFPSNLYDTHSEKILDETEKQAIFDLVNKDLLKSLKYILDSQKCYYYEKLSPKQKYYIYHNSDKRLIGADYGEFIIDGCPYVFRALKGQIKENYVCVLGSATVFGRFVKRPFVDQLNEYAEKLGLELSFVNLGLIGARPSTYLASSALIDFMAKSKFCIIELMSARGYINSIFEPNYPVGDRGIFRIFPNLFDKPLPANDKIQWFAEQVEKSNSVSFDRLEIILPYLNEDFKRMIFNIVRYNYLNDLFHLVNTIKRPVLFVFFTRRTRNYILNQPNTDSYKDWTGGYPHFIDRFVIELLEERQFPVIKVVSSKGMPFTITHWKTGEPAAVFPWQENPSVNSYYPSQEIHDEIFLKIVNCPVFMQYIEKVEQ